MPVSLLCVLNLSPGPKKLKGVCPSQSARFQSDSVLMVESDLIWLKVIQFLW